MRSKEREAEGGRREAMRKVYLVGSVCGIYLIDSVDRTK